MSIIKLPKDAFDVFTVTARPERIFTSSSSGITGDVKVFKTVSQIEKDTRVFNDTAFDDASVEGILDDAKINGASIGNISELVEKYLDGVNALDSDPKNNKSVEVIRFEPSYTFTSDTLRKSVIKNILLPYYRIAYPQIGWGYTNYCSIHFPDNIGPTSASIIYPNPMISGQPVYTPEKDFTIEFYIKPSYTGQTYAPGTIMHMSSCFAVSLVAGESKDYKGNIESFRLLLQLTHSADVKPSNISMGSLGTNPLEYAFLSSDGHIKKNKWHHVAINWSPTHDDSTGSFYVDGKRIGGFLLPSGLNPFEASYDGTSALFLGNYYNGKSDLINGPHGFFSLDAVNDEGVTNAFNATTFDPLYPIHTCSDPFRGELHEIRIWNYRRDGDTIISGSKDGVGIDDRLLFYLPPFFRKETSERKVLQTPFTSHLSVTDDPFNVAMSYSVAGHHINVENHTRELVRGYYPRLLNLTSSEITTTFGSYASANTYLYGTGSTVRRNLTILPCDNGKFKPNFSLLLSGTSYSSGEAMEKFVNDDGLPDLTFVNMSKLLDDSMVYASLNSNNDIFEALCGPTPEEPGIEPGSRLTIFERTADNSSNCVSIFDASNLFYGGRINEGSYELIDPAFTGSNGTMNIKLKDNKHGVLYRADADSEHATWSSVGFVLYPEGISVITCPYFGEMFGKDDFNVRLLGTQQVHVLEIQSIAPAWSLNSSSNPNWSEIRLTNYANDKEPGFVSINRINFHDENLNIVAKTELAHPINKRYSDRIMFRTKFDF